MRRDASTISEALDAASGGVLFAALVVCVGGVVGVAGWAVGNYPTVGLLVGCATLSALVASAVWGVLRWGIDEPVAPTRVPVAKRHSGSAVKRAA